MVDVVEFMARLLSRLPDARVQQFVDGTAELTIPLDPKELAALDEVRFELRRGVEKVTDGAPGNCIPFTGNPTI